MMISVISNKFYLHSYYDYCVVLVTDGFKTPKIFIFFKEPKSTKMASTGNQINYLLKLEKVAFLFENSQLKRNYLDLDQKS